MGSRGGVGSRRLGGFKRWGRVEEVGWVQDGVGSRRLGGFKRWGRVEEVGWVQEVG